jgi:hypothetical protein
MPPRARKFERVLRGIRSDGPVSSRQLEICSAFAHCAPERQASYTLTEYACLERSRASGSVCPGQELAARALAGARTEVSAPKIGLRRHKANKKLADRSGRLRFKWSLLQRADLTIAKASEDVFKTHLPL